ncbi:aspartic peptidase domain-containing protein [Hyaloscypha sp. PMI_1271]|nr:aspartic peptidase domain-containing protein [Hyaloscypha sp. PMI_1271]
MLSTPLTAVLALATLSSASVLPNAKRDAPILKLPVTTVNQTCPLSKRQDAVSLANIQTGTRYLISFSIGTPQQTVRVAIDTGSSDTWVNPTCSTSGTTADTTLCNGLPVFQPGSSSTLQDTGVPMNLAYGRGTAQGKYYKDTVVLGGGTITGQQFGVATSTTELPNGFMGVGPGIELTGYPTIIDTLATEGITQSRAFSLDLRGVDSAIGSIIFGGIDTMKYTGALEKCPIIPAAEAPDNFHRYWIYMTSVGITKPGAAPKTYSGLSTPAGQPVFLDSGGTLSRLPTTLFNAILADFPTATADPAGSGIYEVPCSVAAQDGTMDFGFGNTVVHVPFHEFIWQADTNLCALGVVADDSSFVLGDTFLRAAYVVYDQDNQNLHIANAADCGTNLVAISKGVDAVPSITGACGSSPTTPPSSSTSSKPTVSTSSSTRYSNSTTKATYPSSTLSTVYSTTTYTVSSCAPTVTNCPYGHLTTETISLYTTYCPVEATSTPVAATYTPIAIAFTPVALTPVAATYTPIAIAFTPVAVTPVAVTYAPVPTTYAPIQSLVYVTTTYTISSCAPSVEHCPYGSTTTETYAAYTNIASTETGSVYPYVTPTGTGSVYPYATASSKGQEFTGGAGKVVGGAGMLMLVGLAGLALL